VASVPQAGPNEIRNVVLVGDSSSGKTTLVEAALFATGALSRPGRVEDGNTVTDYDPVEMRQQRSINLALAPTAFDGLKINFIDTPGYADFVGDLRAGCARPTRHCSWSPRRRASPPRPGCCGVSARRWAWPAR
jgi:translation elongation factor EF-G